LISTDQQTANHLEKAPYTGQAPAIRLLDTIARYIYIAIEKDTKKASACTEEKGMWVGG
jgi:hypothetical protein